MTRECRNVDGEIIIWDRGQFFPLRRAFYRAIYGDLNTPLVEAAARGHTVIVDDWLRRGADLDKIGGEAVRRAYAGGHYNTVASLLGLVSHKELPAGAPSRRDFEMLVVTGRMPEPSRH